MRFGSETGVLDGWQARFKPTSLPRQGLPANSRMSQRPIAEDAKIRGVETCLGSFLGLKRGHLAVGAQTFRLELDSIPVAGHSAKQVGRAARKSRPTAYGSS